MDVVGKIKTWVSSVVEDHDRIHYLSNVVTAMGLPSPRTTSKPLARMPKGAARFQMCFQRRAPCRPIMCLADLFGEDKVEDDSGDTDMVPSESTEALQARLASL
ncbi:hypothetical protein KIPB_007308, partial [Kipferlia bialata]|eukprot:g7308.t1